MPQLTVVDQSSGELDRPELRRPGPVTVGVGQCVDQPGGGRRAITGSNRRHRDHEIGVRDARPRRPRGVRPGPLARLHRRRPRSLVVAVRHPPARWSRDGRSRPSCSRRRLLGHPIAMADETTLHTPPPAEHVEHLHLESDQAYVAGFSEDALTQLRRHVADASGGGNRFVWFVFGFVAALLAGAVASFVFLAVSDEDDDDRRRRPRRHVDPAGRSCADSPERPERRVAPRPRTVSGSGPAREGRPADAHPASDERLDAG